MCFFFFFGYIGWTCFDFGVPLFPRFPTERNLQASAEFPQSLQITGIVSISARGSLALQRQSFKRTGVTFIDVYRSIYPSINYSSIYLCIYLSVCLSVRPSVRPSVHPSIHPSVHPMYLCTPTTVFIVYIYIYTYIHMSDIRHKLYLTKP